MSIAGMADCGPWKPFVPLVEQQGIQSLLQRSAADIDNWLQDLLSTRHESAPESGDSSTLLDAMRYSLLGGGKRIRPVLVLWCCESCGGSGKDARAAALAVECVHTFSLIHDDLPALDDDDMRRGRPTCHCRFGEAMAILAGDALLTLAFELLANELNDPATAMAMLRELSAATGWRGLIAGEAADLDGERADPTVHRVQAVHQLKTARLIEAACKLGGLAAEADAAALAALTEYGKHLGLAFQAVDDLLDATATSDKMGKRTGKDAASGKQTYPRAVGIEETRRIAAALAERAVASLAPFGEKADRLAGLARFVVDRDC